MNDKHGYYFSVKESELFKAVNRYLSEYHDDRSVSSLTSALIVALPFLIVLPFLQMGGLASILYLIFTQTVWYFQNRLRIRRSAEANWIDFRIRNRSVTLDSSPFFLDIGLALLAISPGFFLSVSQCIGNPFQIFLTLSYFLNAGFVRYHYRKRLHSLIRSSIGENLRLSFHFKRLRDYLSDTMRREFLCICGCLKDSEYLSGRMSSLKSRLWRYVRRINEDNISGILNPSVTKDILSTNRILGKDYVELVREYRSFDPEAYTYRGRNLPEELYSNLEMEDLDRLLINLRDNYYAYDEVGNAVFEHRISEYNYIKESELLGNDSLMRGNFPLGPNPDIDLECDRRRYESQCIRNILMPREVSSGRSDAEINSRFYGWMDKIVVGLTVVSLVLFTTSYSLLPILQQLGLSTYLLSVLFG